MKVDDVLGEEGEGGVGALVESDPDVSLVNAVPSTIPSAPDVPDGLDSGRSRDGCTSSAYARSKGLVCEATGGALGRTIRGCTCSIKSRKWKFGTMSDARNPTRHTGQGLEPAWRSAH